MTAWMQGMHMLLFALAVGGVAASAPAEDCARKIKGLGTCAVLNGLSTNQSWAWLDFLETNVPAVIESSYQGVIRDVNYTNSTACRAAWVDFTCASLTKGMSVCTEGGQALGACVELCKSVEQCIPGLPSGVLCDSEAIRNEAVFAQAGSRCFGLKSVPATTPAATTRAATTRAVTTPAATPAATTTPAPEPVVPVVPVAPSGAGALRASVLSALFLACWSFTWGA